MNLKTLTSLPIFRTRPGAKDFRLEDDLQIWALARIREFNNPPVFTNPFSGKNITAKNKEAFIAKLKALGWNSSDPDLLIPYPKNGCSYGLALELKRQIGGAFYKKRTKLKAGSHLANQARKLWELNAHCNYVALFSEGTLNTGLLINWYFGNDSQPFPILERYQFYHEFGRYAPDRKRIGVSKIVGWQIGNDEFYY